LLGLNRVEGILKSRGQEQGGPGKSFVTSPLGGKKVGEIQGTCVAGKKAFWRSRIAELEREGKIIKKTLSSVSAERGAWFRKSGEDARGEP